MNSMKKIIVIGCPGSGKSTFSRKLNELTGIPLFHLDTMYWNAERTTVGNDVFRRRLEEAMQSLAWIIDGNYGSTMEWRMKNCDTVFFLDYAPEVCLEGVRSRRGKKRTDMPWMEAEDEEDAEFIRFVKRYRTESRPKVLELLQKYAEKQVIVLKSRSEADDFLKLIRDYGEMLFWPRPVSSTHPPMPRIDRAAQFAPFSALSGYESAIMETARQTDMFAEQDEWVKAELNRRLRFLKDHLQRRPEVDITYFLPDEKKSGGAYVTVTGQVWKIDDYGHCVVMEDRTEIPMERISDIRSRVLDESEETNPGQITGDLSCLDSKRS